MESDSSWFFLHKLKEGLYKDYIEVETRHFDEHELTWEAKWKPEYAATDGFAFQFKSCY